MMRRGTHDDNDGWTGWVECGNCSITRNGNTITMVSEHRFSARNDGIKDGTFDVNFNHKAFRHIGPGPDDYGFVADDSEREVEPCDSQVTITEDDLGMSATRTTSFQGGAGSYKLEAYTRVDSQHPIEGSAEKIEYNLFVGVP